MRLIDADKLLNDYEELADCDFIHPLYENTLRDIIDDAPTVEVCEDYISRQAVLNLFNKSDEYRWETTWIKRKIEKLPSVTPKTDVLDKIIDEIRNDWQLNKYPASPFSCGLRRAMYIIDKYKEESEG